MARNFGIVTGRSASGAQPPTGPHYGERNTDADSNIIHLPAARPSLRQPNSRADDFNLGAGLLFLVVFFGSVAVVGGVAFAYLTFVPKPAEYARGVEAYRFKGH